MSRAPSPASRWGGSGSSGGGGSGSTAPDATDPTSLLSDISSKLAALQTGLLTLPQNINTFATKEGQPGVGIEPTIRLDEEADYINHLHQLRRVNGGDDLTDMAGYGLYLLRMPISLMPGPDTRKGKGAVVTMEARHELSDDLLEGTFRDVVISDLAYALTQIINEELHKLFCITCLAQKNQNSQPAPNNQPPPTPRAVRDTPGMDSGHASQDEAPPHPGQPGAGPKSAFPADLRFVLGPPAWVERRLA